MVEKTRCTPERVFYQMQEEGISKNVLKVFGKHPWVLLQLFGETNFRILAGKLQTKLKNRVNEAFNCYLKMQRALREREDPFAPKNVLKWLGSLPKIGGDQLFQRRVIELNYSFRMRPFPLQNGLDAANPPMQLLVELEKRQVDATRALHDYLELGEDPSRRLYEIYTLFMKHRALIESPDEPISWPKILGQWAGDDLEKRKCLSNLLNMMQKALPQEPETFLPFVNAPPIERPLSEFLVEKTLTLFETIDDFNIPEQIRRQLFNLMIQDERARLDFNYAIFFSNIAVHKDYTIDRSAYIWIQKLYFYDEIKELRTFDWDYCRAFFKMIFSEDVSIRGLESLTLFFQSYLILIEDGRVEDVWVVFRWIFRQFQRGEAAPVTNIQNAARINCYPYYQRASSLESYVADPENILSLFVFLCEKRMMLEEGFNNFVSDMYCGEVIQLLSDVSGNQPARQILPERFLKQLDPAPEEDDKQLFLKNSPRVHRILERRNGCRIFCKPDRFHAFALFLSLHPELDPDQTENLFDWSFQEEHPNGTIEFIQLTATNHDLEIPFALARKFSEIGCRKMLPLLSYFVFNPNKASDWNELTARQLLQCFPQNEGEHVVRIFDTFFSRHIDLSTKSAFYKLRTFNRLYYYHLLENGTEQQIFELLVNEHRLSCLPYLSRRLRAFFQLLTCWKYESVEDFQWLLSLFCRNSLWLHFEPPPKTETRESCHEQILFTQRGFAEYADDPNLLLIFLQILKCWDQLKGIADNSPKRHLFSDIFYNQFGEVNVQLPILDLGEEELYALWLYFANIFMNIPKLSAHQKKELVLQFFCKEFLEAKRKYQEEDLFYALSIVGRLIGVLRKPQSYYPLFIELLDKKEILRELEKQNLNQLFHNWKVEQVIDALDDGETLFLSKEEKLARLDKIQRLSPRQREEVTNLPGAQWCKNALLIGRLTRFVNLSSEEIVILFKAQPILSAKVLRKFDALSDEIILDIAFELNQTGGVSETFQRLVLDLPWRLHVAMQLVKLREIYDIPMVETDLLEKEDEGRLLMGLSFVLLLSELITLNKSDVLRFLKAMLEIDEKQLDGLLEITKNYSEARQKIAFQSEDFPEKEIWDRWLSALDNRYMT